MKWLVYGGLGWIGSMITSRLREMEEVVIEAEGRADDEVQVEQVLLEHKPDRVLCLIGRTHGPGHPTIDYLEHKDKLLINVRDNLYAPIVMTILCHKYNIHLTYLGTGCIFNNLAHEKQYNENDKPDFFGSSYSVVKGFTDQLLHFYNDTVLNVRIRMPIVGYHHQRNFITKIVQYEYICSIQNSMTVLPDMIPVLIDMAKKQVTGTINLTNPGTIEHNEILTMYKAYVDPDFTWKNFTNDEQNHVLLSERSNNHLDTSRLEILYPNILNIRDSVRLLLQHWTR